MQRRASLLMKLTLGISLLLNAVVVGAIGVFAWWWFAGATIVAAPVTPVAATATTPAEVHTPTSTTGEGSAAAPQPSVEIDPHELLRERVGLTTDEWRRVTEGEVVLRRVLDDGSVAIQGWFMTRGTPERALDLLTGYANISRIYTDVESATVLASGALHARVHYRAKYGPLDEQWVVDERWKPGELRWQVVHDPERPSRLRRTEGFWKLESAGNNMLLLWYRNTIEFAGIPDPLVRRITASTVPGIADRLRRELAK